jgi:MFS transporter, DHA2 family, multidrug resistance protein
VRHRADLRFKYRGIISIGQTIRSQATIMGYAASFAPIGVALLLAAVAVAMPQNDSTRGATAH